MQIIEDLNRIGNVDETLIWFYMTYNTTISKIREKSVKVRTLVRERLEVSLILSILADGEKLPPLIIFKGTKNGPKENRQNDNIDVKNKEIFIRYNENYWAYEDLFYEWLNKKWFGTNAIIKPASKTQLIMDSVTTHLSQLILDLFKENKSNYILIPLGATRYLQPLDLSIKKPFKDNMQKKNTEFVIKFGGNKKPVDEDLIEWVISSWCEPNAISKDIIINSFKKTAILMILRITCLNGLKN